MGLRRAGRVEADDIRCSRAARAARRARRRAPRPRASGSVRCRAGGRRSRGAARRSGCRSGPGRRCRPWRRSTRCRGNRRAPSRSSRPLATVRSASLRRRAAARVRVIASSAVAFVRTSGVLVTTTSRARHASRLDVVVADREVCDYLQPVPARFEEVVVDRHREVGDKRLSPGRQIEQPRPGHVEAAAANLIAIREQIHARGQQLAGDHNSSSYCSGSDLPKVSVTV